MAIMLALYALCKLTAIAVHISHSICNDVIRHIAAVAKFGRKITGQVTVHTGSSHKCYTSKCRDSLCSVMVNSLFVALNRATCEQQLHHFRDMWLICWFVCISVTRDCGKDEIVNSYRAQSAWNTIEKHCWTTIEFPISAQLDFDHRYIERSWFSPLHTDLYTTLQIVADYCPTHVRIQQQSPWLSAVLHTWDYVVSERLLLKAYTAWWTMLMMPRLS